MTRQPPTRHQRHTRPERLTRQTCPTCGQPTLTGDVGPAHVRLDPPTPANVDGWQWHPGIKEWIDHSPHVHPANHHDTYPLHRCVDSARLF